MTRTSEPLPRGTLGHAIFYDNMKLLAELPACPVTITPSQLHASVPRLYLLYCNHGPNNYDATVTNQEEYQETNLLYVMLNKLMFRSETVYKNSFLIVTSHYNLAC